MNTTLLMFLQKLPDIQVLGCLLSFFILYYGNYEHIITQQFLSAMESPICE
jgi:hypothetical protein